ncbi:MAG TPA: inositol monophosphatase family protein [Thermoplasmata archaeon]|nr:inositol monophosphatase family protein [Thermoplasmata archaeon]
MTGGTRAELEVLYRISVAVHQVVRDAEGSPHRADVVAMGADGTPTEELDRLAEAEILKVLDAEGVNWNLLSEEIGKVDRGGTSTLVVDPIDGTSNALRNLPFSTVSLALGDRDLSGIEVGLVRDLHRGTTYWAARGEGAFRDGRSIHTRSWNPRSEIFFVNLGRPATERAARLAVKSRRIRSLGCASFEMLMVAQGSTDGYFFENSPETRNLRATDVAAAYRILLEAGGGMNDAKGQPVEGFPLTVEQRTSVFAWGDPKFRARAEEDGYL